MLIDPMAPLSNSPALPSSPLLNLPPELRLHIWTILYTEVMPPDIVCYRPEDAECIYSTSYVYTAPIAICKLLTTEIQATLWRHAVVHLHNQWNGKMYPCDLPPRRSTEKVQHLVWQLKNNLRYSTPEIFRLPTARVLYSNFPSLKTFTVLDAKGCLIDQLPVGGRKTRGFTYSEGTRILETRAAFHDYQALSPAERITQFREIGCFEPRRLMREAHAHPPNIHCDYRRTERAEGSQGLLDWLNTFIHADWKREDLWIADGPGPVRNPDDIEAEAMRGQLKRFAAGINVYFKAEIWLMGWRADPTWEEGFLGPLFRQPVVVTVDCRRCAVTEVREHSIDETAARVQNQLTSYEEMEAEWDELQDSRRDLPKLEDFTRIQV